MHKQIIFMLTSAILLTAVVAALYTLKAANAQTNMTSAGGNMTKGVNVTKVTNPATGVTIGKIEKINNTSSGGNMTNATQ